MLMPASFASERDTEANRLKHQQFIERIRALPLCPE